MRRLSVRIREATVEAARRRLDPLEFRQRIIDILRDEGFQFGADGRVIDAAQSTAMQDFLRIAERQFEWIVSNSLGDIERQAVSEIFAQSAPGFARVGDKILDDVVREFQRGVAQNLKTSAIENVVASRLGSASRYAGGIVQTGLKGFDTAHTLAVADKAGVEKFRYGGPGLVYRSRIFCEIHYGKEYTITEIRNMANDVGPQPVLIYRGGWECRHTWDPVI